MDKLAESTKLYELGLENDKLSNQSKNVAAELATYLSETSGFADDEFFQSEWAKLHGRIENWSQNNFRGSSLPLQSEEDPSTRDQRYFRLLSKDPHFYMKSPYEWPYFVQSPLWSTLVEKIFTYPSRNGRKDLSGLYWSDCQRDQLDSLVTYLHPGE